MAESEQTPPTPTPFTTPTANPETAHQQQRIVIIAVVVGVLVLAGIIAAVYLLLQPSTPTDKIRDIFIIFMAFESLILGTALVVLIIQLASLINLLNNEVKPILDATNETINTLRGTTEFLGENLVEPVMKLNSYLAGLQQLLKMIGMKQK